MRCTRILGLHAPALGEGKKLYCLAFKHTHLALPSEMEPSILGPSRPPPLRERGCLGWQHGRLRGATDIPERSGAAAAFLGSGVNVYTVLQL